MTRIFRRLFLWKWIPCQAGTSVLCLLFRPKTVHFSKKNVYTSEITFLALVPWAQVSKFLWHFSLNVRFCVYLLPSLSFHYASLCLFLYWAVAAIKLWNRKTTVRLKLWFLFSLLNMKDRQWKDDNKLINSMVLLRISLIIFKNMFFNSNFCSGFLIIVKKTFFCWLWSCKTGIIAENWCIVYFRCLNLFVVHNLWYFKRWLLLVECIWLKY